MGNAYDNASLIVTPNAYKASKIYALKPTDGSGDLSFSRAGSKMVRNSAGLWETIATNIPPLSYPVGGGCPSWLFEAEATNEFIVSNDGFSNNGTNGSSAISTEPTNIVGVNFRKMTASAIDGFIFSNATDVPVRTGIMITSVLLKKGSCDVVQLIDQNTTGKQITVNLTSGTVVSSNFPLGSGITHDGNGQYWVWAIQDYTSIGYRFDLYAKQVGDFYYLTAQMISGTALQSPIITTGTAVTRLRDVPTGTMVAGTLGYTIVTNVNSLTNTAAIRNFLDLSNGSGRQGILAKSAANKLIFQVYLNGTLVNTLTSTNDLPSGMGKCAIVFNGTTYKIFMDGGLEGTLAAVGGFPNAYGFNDAASNIEQKDLEYYNVALSDSEIVDLITA